MDSHQSSLKYAKNSFIDGVANNGWHYRWMCLGEASNRLLWFNNHDCNNQCFDYYRPDLGLLQEKRT